MDTTILERNGETLIVRANHDLRELDSRDIDAEGEEILRRLDDPGTRNVVIDLTGTDYYGSSALNLFIKIERKIEPKGGRLVLVGLSPHEREILHITRLEGRWTICRDRDEALAKLTEKPTRERVMIH